MSQIKVEHWQSIGRTRKQFYFKIQYCKKIISSQVFFAKYFSYNTGGDIFSSFKRDSIRSLQKFFELLRLNIRESHKFYMYIT